MTPEQIMAQINAKAFNGWTPLHFAACYGHASAISLLLARGAIIDARTSDKDGCRTPLHFAAQEYQIDAIKALLKYMAPEQINIKDKNDQTALQIAEEMCFQGVAELIQNKLAERT
jgi:ankyrin repeat protein